MKSYEQRDREQKEARIRQIKAELAQLEKTLKDSEPVLTYGSVSVRDQEGLSKNIESIAAGTMIVKE